jgi:hypothetical protein
MVTMASFNEPLSYYTEMIEHGLSPTMVTDLTSLLLGVAGSLIATFIAFGLKKGYDSYIVEKSEYSGYWRTDIYEGDTVVKIDYMLLKYDKRTSEFKGKIKRGYPNEQDYKDRVCKGVFAKDAMLTVVWSKINILSYGVSHKIMSGDFEYSGYYQKHDKETTNTSQIKLVSRKLIKSEDIKRAKKLFK